MNIRLLGILVISLWLSACQTVHSDQVCFKSQCFTVEIMQSSKDRQKGMQGRTSLESSKGMLFVFENDDRHTFWMKDTLIPLDMIWINQDLRVVGIQNNAQPCDRAPCQVFAPQLPSRYVLELKAGIAEAIGIDRNDQVEFKLNKTVEFADEMD